MWNENEPQTTEPLDIASGAARQVEHDGNLYLPEHRINPTDLISAGNDELLLDAIIDPLKNAEGAVNNFNCIIDRPHGSPAQISPPTSPGIETALPHGLKDSQNTLSHTLKDGQYGSAKYIQRKNSYRNTKKNAKRSSRISRQIRSQLTEKVAIEADDNLGQTIQVTNTANRAREAALFAGKKTVWAVRKTIRTAHNAVEATQIVLSAAKRAIVQFFSVHGLFGSIVLLSGIILVLLVALIASVIPAISLKTDITSMTAVYQHITELDARLTEEIRDLESSNSAVNEYHFYINGHETDSQGVLLQTNADLFLLYLDTKYPEYSIEKNISGTFGETSILEEVTQIHSRLYSYSTRIWTEEITEPPQEPSPDSPDRPMPMSIAEDSTGTDQAVQTVTHMDIDIYYQSFESFLNVNKDFLLTKEEQDQYDLVYSAGMYSTKTELGSPFPGRSFYTVLRWGWRYNAYSGSVSMHTGIDIQMPYGTEVSSVLSGTVTECGVSSLGNYIRITSGDRSVLYAQLATVAVELDSTVKKGDVIGTVGVSHESGSSSTALHLEYNTEDGPTNPAFFLTGAMYTTPPSSDNSDWVCPVSYDFISSPWGWRTHPIFEDWRFHDGIDLSAQMYTPIVAARSGTVSGASYNDSAGNYVLLDHGDGFTSNYYHMTYSVVSPGQEVSAGEIIGYVGSTGDSTGPHLHFEIRIDGESVDPSNYIRFE